MPRYIDADALIEEVKRVYCADCNNYNEIRCRACGTDDALRMIEDAPTADVVEVVRCKDCKHCEMVLDIIGNPNLFCTRIVGSIPVDFTDFCSYGERKYTDGDGND